MKLKAPIAEVHRGLRKPSHSDYRDMAAGETRIFRYDGAASARYASSLQTKLGGNFVTTKQILVDPNTGDTIWVLLVLCVTPPPAPPPRRTKPNSKLDLQRRVEQLERKLQHDG